MQEKKEPKERKEKKARKEMQEKKEPKLVLAAEDFAEHLRTTIKYNENLSAEELRVYTRLQERFYGCFQGLLNG